MKIQYYLYNIWTTAKICQINLIGSYYKNIIILNQLNNVNKNNKYNSIILISDLVVIIFKSKKY